MAKCLLPAKMGPSGLRYSFLTEIIESLFFFRDSATVNKVYPLSLLAFVASAHTLSVSRQPPPRHREETAKSGIGSSRGCGEGGRVPAQIAGLDHLFRRHVKPKKQHEIRVLAEV